MWQYARSIIYQVICFNPHTYMRCDKNEQKKEFNEYVSIHTPTWGVTFLCISFGVMLLFQSTHLHEVWHACTGYTMMPSCFNPHTYMRCDLVVRGTRPDNTVSIHTPTWGVTPSAIGSVEWYEFQSTHLHEVWRSKLYNEYEYSKVSIHTPTWGVTSRTRNKPTNR